MDTEELMERQRIYSEAFKKLSATCRGYSATPTEGDINAEGEYQANVEFPDVHAAASWALMVRDNWGIHANLRDTIGSLWQTVVLTIYMRYDNAELITRGRTLQMQKYAKKEKE